MSANTDHSVRATPDPPAPTPPGHGRAHKLAWSAGLVAVGVATVAVVATQVIPSTPFAATNPVKKAGAQTTNCSAVPSKCGYPDGTSTGPPAAMLLKTVPAQVSSGPGWKYNAAAQEVDVTGNGTSLTGLYIPYSLNITANNVTVNDVHVVTTGLFGVSLRHTTGVTIENSTVNGTNATAGRVSYAIDDIYGDSSGMTIKDNNISAFRTAVAASTGVISGNYIHDPGFVSGDHTNGIFDAGTTQPLTISNNTILVSFDQTDAISLDASSAGVPVANKTVTGNLIGGGSYTIYGGAARGDVTTNMVVRNNDFCQLYFARSGYYGPASYYDSAGSGNAWSGNTWDTTGATVPSP